MRGADCVVHDSAHQYPRRTLLPHGAAPLPSSTQTFHGGQDWAHLSNFVEDFSVTTNGLGTPEGAMEAAYKAVSSAHCCPFRASYACSYVTGTLVLVCVA